MRPIGPSLAIETVEIGRIRVEFEAGFLADGGQELRDGFGHDERELVLAQPCHRLGEHRHGVLAVHERAVPGAATCGETHPAHALFGGLDEVEPPLATVAARHGQRESADLADGLGDALEQVGTVVHQPLAAVLAAGFLVGDEREHQVAGRHQPFALEVPRHRDHHADHVLHVDRAAAPHVAVLHRAGERVHAPVGSLGGHHVEVAVNHQRTPIGVGAGQPGEDVSSARRARFDVLGLVADLFESLRHPAGAFGLTLGGLQLARVAGVEANQLADEPDDLVHTASHSHT